MSEGFILLHRQMMESELWKSEPFTRGQAWVDLLMLANHKDGWFRCRGVRVEVKRGQVGHGAVALSKRWSWSRGKTNRFLNELEIDQQIEQQKSNVTTLITIRKYDQYQQNKTARKTPNGQQTDSKQTQTNNDNNDKEIYMLKFEQFWEVWPRKVSKQDAVKSFLKIKPDDLLFKRIINAVKIQSLLWTDKQYIPHPSTWLNKQRWNDEVENKTNKFSQEDYAE